MWQILKGDGVALHLLKNNTSMYVGIHQTNRALFYAYDIKIINFINSLVI